MLRHCGGMGLIVLPLGVRQEFMRDAVQLLHMDAPQYITHQEQAVQDGTVYLTNYERVRDGDIDPTAFTACALDEASVLRSFGSKTYQTFLDKFRYSNPGDLVLDPFGGLGTVALEAIKAGRRGYTIELNNDYFRDAVGYLKEFEDNDTDAVTMFDLIGVSV